MPSAVASHSHRATTKVNNKSFKSKKATKSALRDQAKGMILRLPIPPVVMRSLT